MSTKQVIAIWAAAALTGASMMIGAFSALALSTGTAVAAAKGKMCLIRTYYKDAEMAEQVGIRTNCPGMSSSGRTSRYVEVERIEYGETSGALGGGPAKLPCEFLASGCPNLPLKRP
jgi:hypothetical protein